MKKAFLIAPLVLLLSGCVSTQYDWGSYNQDLYNYYKSPESRSSFKQNLESLVARTESRNQLPPPGVYAELGTLCLEMGDRECAIANYEKEREAWAESATLMTAMIRSLESTQPGTEDGEEQ